VAGDESVGVKTGIGVAGGLTVLFLLLSMFRVVPANHVGVPVSMGHIGPALGSGIHLELPWTKIETLKTTVEELSMLKAKDEGDAAKDDSISIIAKGGGSMSVDETVRYVVDEKQARELYKTAGSMAAIKDRFIRPDARSVTRDVFALYTAEQGYGDKRGEISLEIEKRLRPRLAARGILLDSVTIRDVNPEARVLTDINAILSARNQAVQATEVQKKSVTEAETKRQVAEKTAAEAVVRAQGEADALAIASQAQADSNKRVAQSLTPELLSYKIAQACSDAIKNTGATVVNICGVGSASPGSGSPVIVNGK